VTGAARRAGTGWRIALWAASLCCGGLCVAAPAAAHQAGVSSSEITAEGGKVRVDLTLSSHDLQEVDADRDGVITDEEVVAQYPALRRRFERAIVVQAGETLCPLTLQDFFVDPVGTVLFRFRGPCPDEAPLHVAFQLLAISGAPGYDLSRITFRGNLVQRVFTRDDTTAVVGAADEPPGPMAGRYFALGLASVAARVDHVLLLAALLLVAPGLRPAVGVVAAYAVAQTGGLVLGALQSSPPPRLLEAMAALALAWVALDNVLFDRTGGRWGVALACGAVHGLAFAGMLRAAATVPGPPSILPFVGAVLLSDAVVGAAGLLAATALHRTPARRTAVMAISAAILVFGLYRFVARAFLA
jgi:hypothetical protein